MGHLSAPAFRPAYPAQWEPENPLSFEVGARYWYGFGSQEIRLPGGLAAGTTDQSHMLELHARIDDASTASYLKGQLGFASLTDGEYHATYNGTKLTGPQFSGGAISYAGADFGYMPFGNDAFRFGGFVGYNYWQDSPDYDRQALAGITGPHTHALRLGVAAEAQFNSLIDFRAEIAAVPWSYANAESSSFAFANTNLVGNGDLYNRVHGKMEGNLYGGTAEAMVGIHPTENLTIRAGVRGWLLTGPANFALQADNSSDSSVPTLEFNTTEDVFLSRWGPMVELTARF